MAECTDTIPCQTSIFVFLSKNSLIRFSLKISAADSSYENKKALNLFNQKHFLMIKWT